MEIKKNHPLKSLHTFHSSVDGKYFCEVASLHEIREALEFAEKNNLPLMILGGGSNVLFVSDYQGLIMKVNINGISLQGETEEQVFVKAGAGVNWDKFVEFCVNQGYAGIENLSLIPGNVGAAPIQNIGAYGVELKDHFDSLEFYHFDTNKIMVFSKEDCKFGYRNSIFKNELRGKGVILSVVLKLDKIPAFKTDYGSIKEELGNMKISEYTLKSLRQAVINIRRSKLPDPDFVGNAGSFFKNPEISDQKYLELKNQYPGIVGFPLSGSGVKLAAGWLIDQCGWKGFREGDAGVHDKQALVIVNHEDATGKQIFDLSERILISVKRKFGVVLEREVNVLGSE